MALSAGDIAIVGIQTGNPDPWAFVALVDIPAGEEILFTDQGVKADGTFRTNANEGVIKYTVPAGGITAGTVITFTSVGGDFSAESGNFGLGDNGDQLIAYQDDGSVTFLFASQTNSSQFQADATSNRNSSVPPGLVEGETAVALGSGPIDGNDFDNAAYTGTLSGTREDLLASIGDPANWDKTDGPVTFTSGPFTVVTQQTFLGTPTPNENFVGAPSSDDTVDYSGSANPLGVLVDLDPSLSNNPPFSAAGRGDSTGDSFSSIENVIGTNFEDSLRGDNVANTLEGRDGDDAMAGRGGDDTLLGGDGDDRLFGGDGADVLDGGDDSDTAVYRDATVGVSASLSAPGGNSGFAAGDTYISIENLEGSLFGDILVGDGGDNTLSGLAGSDVMAGGGGDDVLLGGNGGDNLSGDLGNDVLSGGLGMDLLSGGAGDDILHGGADADTFDFDADGSFDRVRDFEDTIDLLDVQDLGITAFSDFDRVFDAANGSAVLIEGATTIVLQNTAVADLSDADFILRPSATFIATLGGVVENFPGSPGVEDTVDYSASVDPLGILVDLDPSLANNPVFAAAGRGESANDTFTSIDNVIGTDFADSIRGTNDENELFGGGGDDLIAGRGGFDALFGQDGNDRLFGGADGDVLDGGDGSDTAVYRDATAGVVADLADPSANTGFAAQDTYISIENLDGSVFDDTLIGDRFANEITGNNGDDTLIGAKGNDTLVGEAGNDTLDGGEGSDTLNGGAGIDILTGGADDDTLTGGTDADTFVFDADGSSDIVKDFENGVDLLDVRELGITAFSDFDRVFDAANGSAVLIEGATTIVLQNTVVADLSDANFILRPSNTVNAGLGVVENFVGSSGTEDTVDYSSSPDTVGVLVDLDPSLANDPVFSAAGRGDSTDDTYTSIENVIGTDFADSIRGSNDDNELFGGDGNDIMAGRGGFDAVRGEDGDDRLFGGSDGDVLDGGDGSDTAVYRDAPVGVRADLADPSTNTGFAEQDTYISIENLDGSPFDDTLIGDRFANTLRGNDGNDSLVGDDGADTLLGELGDDTLDGGLGEDILIGGLGTDTLIGGADDDRLSGGADADIFVFGADGSLDVVRDFEDGSDQLDVSALGVTTLADFDQAFQAANGSVFLEEGGTVIVLTNTLLTDVDDTDFIFV
ncbi:MAG: calcium-binding protein [Pseudomonadota bacterium]